MILEVPSGMLGAFNDAWFRYIADIGPFGQDKGEGGKYLVVPPGYDQELPGGYFIVHLGRRIQPPDLRNRRNRFHHHQ